VTPAGRIELFDDRATFTAPDGVTGFQTAVGTSGVSPLPSAWALPPAEVQQVIDQLQRIAGNGLVPAQVEALRAVLQHPAQRLVQPGTGGWQMLHATVDAVGTATVSISNNTLIITPQGTVVSQGPTPMPVALISADPIAAGIVAFEAALSAALAIYLFVSAILTLRQSPRGGRLHMIYAWLKAPLAILAGVGVALLWGSYASDVMAAPGQRDRNAAMGYGAVLAVAGLAYPVVLWVVLRSRAVREYYEAVRGDG
jgi:hypothetical protein